MRYTLSAFIIASAMPALGQEARYEIRTGQIFGINNPAQQPATLMIDRETGRAWMLGMIDSELKWLPVPYLTPQVEGAQALPPEVSE